MRRLVLAIVLLAIASQVRAGVLNGGFENATAGSYHSQDTFEGWGMFIDEPGGSIRVLNDGTASEGAKYISLNASATLDSVNPLAWVESFLHTESYFYAPAGSVLSFVYRGHAGVDGPHPEHVGASIWGELVCQEEHVWFALNNCDDWTTVTQTVPVSGYYQMLFTAFVSGDVTEVEPQTEPMAHAFANLDIDNVRVVPEPATAVMLAIAAIGLPTFARSRQAARQIAV